MKIALIPAPGSISIGTREETKHSMEQLARQLSQVKFTMLGLDSNDTSENASDVLKSVTSKLDAPPSATIVVSDKDEYLGSARDLGMFTCRVRKKNQPRGNITANYTVEDVKEVQDLINEINGISFNTVFNH
jgi:hypothetical protein